MPRYLSSLFLALALVPGLLGHGPTVAAESRAAASPLLPALKAYVRKLPAGFDSIAPERKRQLEKLALYIKSQRAAGQTAQMIYICTHNSRRSHMAQLFSAAAAAHYGVDGVAFFSGGTEATAFNPRAVAALSRAGFTIDQATGDNPRYKVTFSQKHPALSAFSKTYDDPGNPAKGFAAVMTCSQADKNCPSISGASLRIALPYEDPKQADGKPNEAAVYDERALQIATEAFYVFSRVKG